MAKNHLQELGMERIRFKESKSRLRAGTSSKQLFRQFKICLWNLFLG